MLPVPTQEVEEVEEESGVFGCSARRHSGRLERLSKVRRFHWCSASQLRPAAEVEELIV